MSSLLRQSLFNRDLLVCTDLWLLLGSTILYILKDAAERNRLEGTTFIKLNLMVGLWALGAGVAQGFGDNVFNVRRAGDKLLFAVLFLDNGLVSELRKLGVMKKEEEPDADPPLRVRLI